MVKTITMESLCDYDQRITQLAIEGGSPTTLFNFLQEKSPHSGEALIFSNIIMICARRNYNFKLRALRTFARKNLGVEKQHIMKNLVPYSVESILNDHPNIKTLKQGRFGCLFDAKMGCSE